MLLAVVIVLFVLVTAGAWTPQFRPYRGIVDVAIMVLVVLVLLALLGVVPLGRLR